MSMTSQRKADRLNAIYEPEEIIDTKRYNMVLGGVVLEGLIVNYILCLTVGNVYKYINPLVFIIGYFVLAIAGTLISQKSKSPIISFIGYNMVVIPSGLVVSTAVEAYGGVDSSLVRNAFLYTTLITVVMITLSIFFEDFFASLGKVLFGCLIGGIIAGILCYFLKFDYGIISYFMAAVFSLYIGYDFYRAQQYEKTYDNAVDCAVDIYLDIINLFLRILQILGRGNSKRN